MSHANSPQDGIDWSKRSREFDGVTERAEAGDDRRLVESAMGMKDLLRAVLEPEHYERLESKKVGDARVLAPDGEPIIRTPEEAGSIAMLRPEIGELMAETAYGQTLVRQQQLAVDIERASRVGDREQLDELNEAKLKLDTEIVRLEFWSAVIALHPISMQYIKDNLPYQFGGGREHVSQVKLVMRIESEIAPLVEFNQMWTPGQIDAQRKAAKTDQSAPWWAGEWVDDMEKRSEENSLRIKGYSKVLDDIVGGRTHQDTDAVPSSSTGNMAEKKDLDSSKRPPRYEILKNLPGIDPVEEIMAGRLKDLPKEGWLIDCTVNSAGYDELCIIAFKEGSLRFQDSYVSPAGDKVNIAVQELGNKGNSIYWAQYGKFSNVRGDAIPMEGGKWLKSIVSRDRTGGSSRHIGWQDMDKDTWRLEASRMTTDPDIVREITQQSALAMGMTEKEISRLLRTLTSNFDELLTEDEKAARHQRYKKDQDISPEELKTTQAEVDDLDLTYGEYDEFGGWHEF